MLRGGGRDLFARLQDPDPVQRWDAAHVLATNADAVPDLIAALLREEDRTVCATLFTSVVVIGSEAVAAALLPLERACSAVNHQADHWWRPCRGQTAIRACRTCGMSGSASGVSLRP